MINFDDVPNWPQIPDHPYRILTIGGLWSGKINLLFDLIVQKTDIDKIYLYQRSIWSKD